MLKLEIPTALAQPKSSPKCRARCSNAASMAKRSRIRIGAAVQGKIGDADYTVALLNNSTYSYDCLNGLFRTVLIRSAPFARHNPNQVPHNDNNAWQDQGRQERTFWLMAGAALFRICLDRRAEELQTPAEYVMDSAHPGTEPWEKSFLEIMPRNVWVLAIKRAEAAPDQTIIRLQERSGKATQATLQSAVLGLNRTVELAPWEIKTLLVSPGGKLREVSLLEV